MVTTRRQACGNSPETVRQSPAGTSSESGSSITLDIKLDEPSELNESTIEQQQKIDDCLERISGRSEEDRWQQQRQLLATICRSLGSRRSIAKEFYQKVLEDGAWRSGLGNNQDALRSLFKEMLPAAKPAFKENETAARNTLAIRWGKEKVSALSEASSDSIWSKLRALNMSYDKTLDWLNRAKVHRLNDKRRGVRRSKKYQPSDVAFVTEHAKLKKLKRVTTEEARRVGLVLREDGVTLDANCSHTTVVSTPRRPLSELSPNVQTPTNRNTAKRPYDAETTGSCRRTKVRRTRDISSSNSNRNSNSDDQGDQEESERDQYDDGEPEIEQGRNAQSVLSDGSFSSFRLAQDFGSPYQTPQMPENRLYSDDDAPRLSDVSLDEVSIMASLTLNSDLEHAADPLSTSLTPPELYAILEALCPPSWKIIKQEQEIGVSHGETWAVSPLHHFEPSEHWSLGWANLRTRQAYHFDPYGQSIGISRDLTQLLSFVESGILPCGTKQDHWLYELRSPIKQNSACESGLVILVQSLHLFAGEMPSEHIDCAVWRRYFAGAYKYMLEEQVVDGTRTLFIQGSSPPSKDEDEATDNTTAPDNQSIHQDEHDDESALSERANSTILAMQQTESAARLLRRLSRGTENNLEYMCEHLRVHLKRVLSDPVADNMIEAISSPELPERIKVGRTAIVRAVHDISQEQEAQVDRLCHHAQRLLLAKQGQAIILQNGIDRLEKLIEQLRGR